MSVLIYSWYFAGGGAILRLLFIIFQGAGGIDSYSRETALHYESRQYDSYYPSFSQIKQLSSLLQRWTNPVTAVVHKSCTCCWFVIVIVHHIWKEKGPNHLNTFNIDFFLFNCNRYLWYTFRWNIFYRSNNSSWHFQRWRRFVHVQVHEQEQAWWHGVEAKYLQPRQGCKKNHNR